MASTVGGTSRPSALAVTRLTTRSNLVGCSTGMSAGFAPRRILSTYSAARRAIPLPSTCPVAWRYLMRHVSLHPSSLALPPWLRPRSNGHKRMPRQNRLRPSRRSRRKICRRAMEEEGGESFDHLVGAGEKGFRNRKANRFRGFDVDDKFKLGGLIDRQLGGRRAIENAPHVDSRAAIIIERVVAVAHQPPLFDKFAVGVHGGDAVTRRQRNNLLPPAGKERIATDKKRAARRSRIVAKAASISLGVLASRTSNCRPRVRAASCASLGIRAASGSFGFANSAISATLGTSSCSSPSALPARRALNMLTPVTLPPGRLRLAT